MNTIEYRMKPNLIFLAFLFSSLLSAQENFIFSPVNTSNGLSDNRVRAIDQLKDGRMVFATEGAINIYNGSEFSYLHTDDNKTYEISNYSGFHKIYIDDENYLWLKNQTKLTCFNLFKEKFVDNLDSLFKGYNIKSSVVDFYVDTNKNYWYLTNKNELYFRKKHDKTAKLKLLNVLNKKEKSESLLDLEAKDSLFYLFYNSGQLACYSLKSGNLKYTDNTLPKDISQYDRTHTVVLYMNYFYVLRNSIIQGSNLARYDYINRKWKNIYKANWKNGIITDKDGAILLCSKNGITKVDEKSEIIKEIPLLKTFDGDVIETEVSTQFIDKDGGFWVGTVNGGIYYYHTNRFRFKSYDNTLFGKSDKKNFDINCFIDFNGDILTGTNNGLFIFNDSQRKAQIFPGIPSDVFCNQLMKDSKNRIWLCTRKHGLFCITNGKINQFKQSFVCQYLYETTNGRFFLTTTDGFGELNPDTGEYAIIEKSSNLGHIFQLIQFEKNKLIGVLYGDAGLFVYDIKNKTLEFPDENKYKFLRHNNRKYHDIFIDSRQFIWFGTQDGLNMYNPKDGYYKCFLKEDGLINNNVRSITEDKYGRIWVTTSYGISCVQPENNYRFSFHNFNHLDGVNKNEFLPRADYVSNKNKILWGGLNGFNIIDLSDFNRKNSFHNKPMLMRFYISGKEIKAGLKYDGNLILRNTINNTKSITLKHNQNFISFDVTALNYINPTQTYYRYKLEGIDNQWIETRPSNGIGNINYTNLSPGKYTLKVKATNNIQEWSESYSQLSIIINPPFLKTRLALTLYVIFFICIITLTVKYFIRSGKRKIIKKQKEELEKIKMAFYTNISHELKTPLSLVITPLDSLIKKYKEEPLKSKLTNIYRNATDLLELVNQLLDFRKLEMNGENLNLDYCNLDDFLQNIFENFNEYAKEKDVNLSLELKCKGVIAMVDSDKIRKITNNLLSNALKHTERGGSIKIELDKGNTDEVFMISVSDTGCGIPEKELPYIFDRFYQAKQISSTGGSGIGLHLVKQYVQMHNGEISVASELGAGSTFIVKIPIQQDSQVFKSGNKNIVKSGYKILIVEDNLEFRNFLENELSDFYVTDTATNGLEGLEKAKSILPDLIITDVMMPIMNGTELCSKIKNDINISHIPVIMLTAKSSSEDKMEGFKVHADAYITKPFKMDILLIRINNLIELQKKRKAKFKNEIEINPNLIVTTKVDEEFMNSLMKYINLNLGDINYTVEQLSSEMSMDRTNLYRKITAITGLSPIEFIRSVRLKKAATLLEEGNSIADVASMVGFGTVSYFSKCFKIEFNVKPSQYKNIR